MKTNDCKKKKRQPPNKKKQHEPMTELKKMIYQVAMLRRVGHHAHPFI
jgi:hypothetical protein